MAEAQNARSSGGRATAEALPRLETPWQRFRRRFFSRPATVLSLAYLVLMAGLAVLGPLLVTHPPNAVQLLRPSAPPSSLNWLGTDDLGRDMFSRLLMATRVSMLASAQAVLIAVGAGLPVGLASGYFGGPIDALAMRFVDLLLVFPTLVFAIAIIGMLGPSLTSAMTAVGIGFAPYFARVVRGAVLNVRNETYVAAARQLGASDWRVLRRHILPNILSPIIVQTTLIFGLALLAEAGLSFLGLGVQAPEASWGSLLQRSFQFMHRSMLNMILPGVLIMTTVLACNFLGDGLRDSLGREERGTR